MYKIKTYTEIIMNCKQCKHYFKEDNGRWIDHKCSLLGVSIDLEKIPDTCKLADYKGELTQELRHKIYINENRGCDYNSKENVISIFYNQDELVFRKTSNSNYVKVIRNPPLSNPSTQTTFPVTHFSHKPYYEDLCKWLKEDIDINGKKYFSKEDD